MKNNIWSINYTINKAGRQNIRKVFKDKLHRWNNNFLQPGYAMKGMYGTDMPIEYLFRSKIPYPLI